MNTHQRVESLLQFIPATRNSDKELQIAFMQRLGMDLTPKQIAIFKDMPSMETIRRSRQAIQMEGKYPATKEVEEARYKKYVVMKQGVEYVAPSAILENEQIRETVNNLFKD